MPTGTMPVIEWSRRARMIVDVLDDAGIAPALLRKVEDLLDCERPAHPPTGKGGYHRFCPRCAYVVLHRLESLEEAALDCVSLEFWGLLLEGVLPELYSDHLPDKPTNALPGQPGKVEAMTARREAGQRLQHPADPSELPDALGWVCGQAGNGRKRPSTRRDSVVGADGIVEVELQGPGAVSLEDVQAIASELSA